MFYRPPSCNTWQRPTLAVVRFSNIKNFLTNRTLRIPGLDGQPFERSPYIEELRSVQYSHRRSLTLPWNLFLTSSTRSLTLNMPSMQTTLPSGVPKKNAGEKKSTLQEGLDIIAAHAQNIGLHYSPEKSECVVVINSYRRRAETRRNSIKPHLDGLPVPKRHFTKILNFFRQQNEGNAEWMKRIIRSRYI